MGGQKGRKILIQSQHGSSQLPFGHCKGTAKLLRKVFKVETKNWDHARDGEGAESTVLGVPLSSGPS